MGYSRCLDRGEVEGGTHLRQTAEVVYVYDHAPKHMSDALVLGLFGEMNCLMCQKGNPVLFYLTLSQEVL